MKKHLNFKNIAIAVLVVIVLLEFFNPFGNMPGRTIRVDGKKYEVIKHTVDTIDVIKTKVVTKKGEDIYHETIKEVVIPTIVDTTAILQNYYSKVVYKDVLVLPDSLGTVAVTDTITQNKIAFRTFDAKVKQRTIKETTIVKELPKNQVYIGVGGVVGNSLAIAGPTLSLKTKKDNIYGLNVYVDNNLNKYIGVNLAWKIKLKK
jgi:hypothetical protein